MLVIMGVKDYVEEGHIYIYIHGGTTDEQRD